MSKEYFIIANTFAAPFFSNTITTYIRGRNADEALNLFMEQHPQNIYAANVYESADDYHHKKDSVAQYRSNKSKADGW